MKKNAIIIGVILILNFILIFASIKSGLSKRDIAFRFQEKETLTFFSALLLGFTGLVSLIIYKLKMKMVSAKRIFDFWLLSALGFFYLCLDEYFMGHEGIDDAVASLFRTADRSLELDGLTLGFFGSIALTICVIFRKELLRHKRILLFFFLGGGCLIGTVIFDLLHHLGDTTIVIEESFKILGVSFFFAGYLTTLFSFIKKGIT